MAKKKKKKHLEKVINRPIELAELWVGIVIFLMVFGVYLRTLSPLLIFGDSGDHISSAYLLGIPHPPGYPTYTMVGWLFSHFLVLSNISMRVNITSAIFSSAAVFFLYLLILKLLPQPTGEMRKIRVEIIFSPAVITSLLFAFSHTFWRIAGYAKIYSSHTFFCALLFFLIIWWRQRREERILWLFAFTCGVSYTNHMLTNILMPSFLFLFLITDWRAVINKRVLPKLIALFILGLLPFLYIPLRALHEPILDWGHPATLQKFLATITLHHQQPMFGYFKTAPLTIFFYNLSYHLLTLTKQFTPAVGWLAILGVYRCFRVAPQIGIFCILIFAINTLLGLTIYELVKGFIDMEAYHLAAFLISAIFISFGIQFLIEKLGAFKKYTVLLVIIPIWACVNNWGTSDLSRFYLAYDHARNLLSHLKDDAIIFPEGDTLLFPLWYLHYVENQRPDIILADPLQMLYDWYSPDRICWYGKKLKRMYPDIDFTSPPDPKPGDDSLFVLDIRLAELVRHNPRNRPIYLLYNENLAEKYHLIPEGVLSLVKSKDTDLINELNKTSKNFEFKYRSINQEMMKEWEVTSILKSYAIIHNIRGVMYQNAKYYLETIKEYSRGLLYAPKFEELIHNFSCVHYYLGNSYEERGMEKEAIKAYQTAIKIEPKNSDAYYAYGIFYQKRGRFKEALVQFRGAIKANPTNTFFYNGLGSAYASLGDYQSAIPEFQKAIEIDPQNLKAYLNMALAYYLLKDYQNAMEIYKKILGIEPDNADAHSKIAMLKQML